MRTFLFVTLMLIIFPAISFSSNAHRNIQQLENTATPFIQAQPLINVQNADQLKKLLEFNVNQAGDMVWSNDGNRLAVTTVDGVDIYNVTQINEKPMFLAVSLTALKFSPHWKFLASADPDNSIEIWDIDKQAKVASLRGHIANVANLAFSPDDRILASSTSDVRDPDIYLWDLTHATQVNVLKGHTSNVTTISFSSNGELLASGSDDNTIRIWRVKDGVQLGVLRKHTNTVTQVAFSPSNSLLASASVDRTVILWDLVNYTDLYSFQGGTDHIGAVFSPDGSVLAIEDVDDFNSGIVTLWSTISRSKIADLKGHRLESIGAVFSPDSTIVVSFGDEKIQVWNAQNGQLLKTFQNVSGNFTRAAFSPDGKFIACESDNGAVELWGIAG